MDILTTGCGLLAAWAAVPALDGFLRWRRLSAPQGGARAPEGARAPGRLLAVIPSRAEGARVESATCPERDVTKRDFFEGGRGGGGRRCASGGRRGAPRVDVLVLLDGPDPDAEARLARDGVHYLSKKSPGPSKGHALAFAAEKLAERLDSYEFILVFDADMRLPEGFFRDLHVPEGVEVFQLPVRPSGVPAPGAPRVEALSLAEALRDDLARSDAGMPVRLRGKAMGFSPRAFRLGPAAATRTTAEDSEATLALLARGVVVRALDGPFAFDTPPADAGAMGRSRARWFGGHLKLLFSGFGDLVRGLERLRGRALGRGSVVSRLAASTVAAAAAEAAASAGPIAAASSSASSRRSARAARPATSDRARRAVRPAWHCRPRPPRRRPGSRRRPPPSWASRWAVSPATVRPFSARAIASARPPIVVPIVLAVCALRAASAPSRPSSSISPSSAAARATTPATVSRAVASLVASASAPAHSRRAASRPSSVASAYSAFEDPSPAVTLAAESPGQLAGPHGNSLEQAKVEEVGEESVAASSSRRRRGTRRTGPGAAGPPG